MFEDFRSLFKGNLREPGKHAASSAHSAFSLQDDGDVKTSIIVIANQKGGCGKTTTAINISAALANAGFEVLLMDLDAQSHASLGLGIDVDRLAHSIYDVIVKNLDLEHCIVPTHINNLEVAPATPMLTGAQLEIADLLGREVMLKTAVYKMLNVTHRKYDYIILDCSPSLNLLTINALVAAKMILIPIQTHYFSLEGMKELFSTIKIVKERLNSRLEILGILPTLFDTRTRMNKDILGQIKGYFRDKVFKTVIRMNVKLPEAQAHRRSIFEHDPNSNGAKDYLALTEEVISLTRPEFSIAKVENPAEAKPERQSLSGAPEMPDTE